MKSCKPCIKHPFQIREKLLKPEKIIRLCCNILHMDYEKVISRSRKQELVEARFMIMTLLRNDISMRLSLTRIANYFSCKDHTTVINAIYKNDIYCETIPEYNQVYYRLHLDIYGHDKYYKYSYNTEV